ncbi:PASTA domain-containing protein [Nocardioides cavernaquae]|nr:PASTA domain-containing protein [Nocardioides cavernaquae]
MLSLASRALVGITLFTTLTACGADSPEVRPDTSPVVEKAPEAPSVVEPVMPDLVGMSYLDGQELLGAALDAAGNDTVIQARTRRTGSAEPGTYVDQSPAPGTVLTAETPIRIFVEEGP